MGAFLTEIPEHLLKRSRERRAAMGGDDDRATKAELAGESSSPDRHTNDPSPSQSSMPTHPAPMPAEPATPPSPMVEAYQKRRRIPFWAMPVLAALPLWAYVYLGTLSPPPAGAGPETLGAELYAGSGCGGCHGVGGAGSGAFPGFTNGRVYETWPSFVDHFDWVRLGSSGWLQERGGTYGATGKPVAGGMPGFGEDQISDADLIFLVLHERSLGGQNPDMEDADALEAVALLLSENPDMTLDQALTTVGMDPPDTMGADSGD